MSALRPSSSPELRCPQCGARNRPDAGWCGQCHSTLGAHRAADESQAGAAAAVIARPAPPRPRRSVPEFPEFPPVDDGEPSAVTVIRPAVAGTGERAPVEAQRVQQMMAELARYEAEQRHEDAFGLPRRALAAAGAGVVLTVALAVMFLLGIFVRH